MVQTSQKELIDRYLLSLGQGDNSALDSLYDLTSKQLYALCYTYFNNRADSEDALSDTYLTVMKHIGKFRGTGGYNWMYTMAKNVCLNKLRKESRVLSVDFDDEETINTLNLERTEQPRFNDESGISTLAKKVLSEREFRILVLHAVSEYKFKDIASIVGGLESTVRWQYNNACKKVRTAYERRNGQ